MVQCTPITETFFLRKTPFLPASSGALFGGEVEDGDLALPGTRGGEEEGVGGGVGVGVDDADGGGGIGRSWRGGEGRWERWVECRSGEGVWSGFDDGGSLGEDFSADCSADVAGGHGGALCSE